MRELTRDDLLTLLIEECAEVIQAVTKCQRFGFNHDEPSYGVNSDVLSKEIGDVLGVVDALRSQLNQHLMIVHQQTKINRAIKAKEERRGQRR